MNSQLDLKSEATELGQEGVSGLEDFLKFRDQFCTLQLAYEMIVDDSLLSVTTNIYPDLSSESEGDFSRLKLKNLYYIPNTVIDLSESSVLKRLVIKYCFDPLSPPDEDDAALSSMMMNDGFAEYLVLTTAGDKGPVELGVSLVLGNSSFRCAFSDISNNIVFEEQSELESEYDKPKNSKSENRVLGRAIHKISSDNGIRNSIQDAIKEGDQSSIKTIILKTLNEENEYHAREELLDETAGLISECLVKNKVKKLTSFLGDSIYGVSW